jgi:hypothetical protein
MADFKDFEIDLHAQAMAYENSLDSDGAPQRRKMPKGRRRRKNAVSIKSITKPTQVLVYVAEKDLASIDDAALELDVSRSAFMVAAALDRAWEDGHGVALYLGELRRMVEQHIAQQERQLDESKRILATLQSLLTPMAVRREEPADEPKNAG